MSGAQRTRAGFSLLEMVLVTAVTIVVLSQVLALFTSQQSTYVNQERALEAQEHVRLVTDMVISDVRMAGLMVPTIVGIATVDGGNSASDLLCTSEPGAISDASLATANTRFTGATLSSGASSGDDQVVLSAGDLDIDGDGSGDFSVGAGIIVGDGTNTHCGTIDSISGNTVTFSPDLANAFGTANTRVVPARVYATTGSGLTRDSNLLSRQVEDLQVEFGVDGNGDGQLTGAEFPIHDLNGDDPSEILTVRVSVTARTLQEDLDLDTPGLPATANRNAGAPDSFRRRRVITSAMPRNMI